MRTRTSWSRCGTEQRRNWSLSSKGKAQQQEPLLPAPVSGHLLQALFSLALAGSAHDGSVTHPKVLIHRRHPRTKQGSRPRSQVHVPPPPCLIGPKPYPSCFKAKKTQVSAGGTQRKGTAGAKPAFKTSDSHPAQAPAFRTALLQARTCPRAVLQEKHRQKINESKREEQMCSVVRG